ncbi:MAG TPA: amidohydrolase family protein [Candidatus Enterocloster faecavium]|uniref:Amidohydrolase family protein n=1 Tax=Candidatus Enterocloster faecavium TaxID=2838560 RepID=A0A9D2RL94_9FIRM|nr:amidohydrolase family protein [Candidatus Enterocloster faecavium]
MSGFTLKSNHILTEQGFQAGYLTVEDGKIVSVSSLCQGGYEDLGDLSVYPGIIDIHNHGFGGWSMTDPCEEKDIRGYAKALTTVGITGVLPTAKEAAFEAIASVMDQEYEGARVLGIHSEGPFWARGGENTVGESWPAPSVKETERLVKLAGGKMAVMALAPEVPGAYEVIRYLHEHKIRVACCHTKAKAQDIYDAHQKAGLDIATHLGNGMQGIHHRDVGALGALLLLDDIRYEVITDLNHICPDMLRIMFRLQPYDKFCLISDSNFIAGLPAGVYMRYGREMYANEKGLILNSDGRICGSGKWVLHNIGQLVKYVGVPEEEAVKMASINPAAYLGIDHITGSIRPGKKADLAVVDASFTCRRTYVGGELVFDREKTPQEALFNPEAMKRRVRDL